MQPVTLVVYASSSAHLVQRRYCDSRFLVFVQLVIIIFLLVLLILVELV